MEVIDHLFYTKEHEWVSIDDGVATVGITEYAQDAMGDITFIELPNVDMEVEQFEQLASVESVKAANDVYSPLSGKVIEVNSELVDCPELLNKSCYELGWIAKVKIASEEETSKLMGAEEYRTYLESLE
ncbi:MAG TPA: glycine cleavage system protein GcvH [Candidatus Omnitrophota bacterium]|jgi:glycine cleavage system H protein|nr:glycine cleavage system protein GcvH [Candidatus Omnitrophota bacterium]HSA30900.1 glycine cleavage system protein GcvH [Candidatus Omnitrophota bacterium]